MGDPRLRLSLDVSAVPDEPVGAGQYTVSLASALSVRTDLDLVLFSRRGDGERWRTGAPRAGLVAPAPRPRPLRLAWEQGRLPALLARQGVDVHHGPHYTMPERSSVPTVVTVHDLSFFEEPAWHQRSKVLLFRRAIKVAARRARAVVCPSRATAEQLARWCRVDARVFVAPHGVDTGRFRPDEPEPGSDAAHLTRLDARLGAGRPLVVFVGTIEPRKNVPALVEGFARAADDHPDALLVLAGGAGWGATAVDRAIERAGMGSRVVRTGYVPGEAVPALLRSATAAVYPALYEGFGLPALEALACGAPLVTTAGTAMEEVAGDAAVLVKLGDNAALADAIGAELDRRPGTGPVDQERRRRGIEVAARHTWASSAGRHVEAYRYAAGMTPVRQGEGPRPTQ
jgi:glycosyltransferase involved in cell wall biosynthesis